MPGIKMGMRGIRVAGNGGGNVGNSLIPRIPTVIPRIPILIPRVPTLVPSFRTLILRVPIIPLIPFPDSPFRLLQIST